MPKSYGRIDWMPRKKVWRVIQYTGRGDVTVGDYPTHEAAVESLQQLVRTHSRHGKGNPGAKWHRVRTHELFDEAFTPAGKQEPKATELMGRIAEERYAAIVAEKQGMPNPKVTGQTDRYAKVTMSKADVVGFKSQWPVSHLPDAAIWFQFDIKNGDLVDVGSSRSLKAAEGTGALLALSQDAQDFAAKQFPDMTGLKR